MFKSLGSLVLTGVAALAGYEWYCHNRAKNGAFPLANGHLYTITFEYSGDPVAPPTQADLQNAFDMTCPAQLNVLSVTPLASSKSVNVTAIYDGMTSSVPASSLAQNWPLGFGSVSAQTVSDGGPFHAPATMSAGA